MVESTGLFRLADLQRRLPVGRDIYPVVATLLAAAAILPRTSAVALLAKDRNELTAADYSQVINSADAIWRAQEGRASDSASPFPNETAARTWPPGTLETVRLAVADLIEAGDLLDNAAAMFEACVEVARSYLSRGLGEPGVSGTICQLMVGSLRAQKGDAAYCAFDGAAEGSLWLAKAGAVVTLDIRNETLAPFMAALACAAKLKLSVRVRDPFATLLAEWPNYEARWQTALVVPPFGTKISFDYPPKVGLPPRSSEAWGLVLAASSATRSAACLVPNGILFRTTLAEQSFKDQLIRRYGLNAVISLPLGALPGAGVATSLLIMDRESWFRDSVLMVDRHADVTGRKGLDQRQVDEIGHRLANLYPVAWARHVPIEEIAGNSFNLAADRYVLPPDAERTQSVLHSSATVVLEEIAEIYRPQALAGGADGLAARDTPELPVWEVAVSDLDEVGAVGQPRKRVTLSSFDLAKAKKAQLQVGDVLLVTKGSVGKVGLVVDVPDDAVWVANQSFAILRLRKHSPIIDPRVLFRFLDSQMGQGIFQRLRVGATIPSIQMADVRNLAILLPSEVEQRKVADEVEHLFALQAQVAQLRSEVMRMQRSIWPDDEDTSGPYA
jgi:type I restriction enzyme M protein